MNQEKRLEILKALQADNPTPKTELEYGSAHRSCIVGSGNG